MRPVACAKCGLFLRPKKNEVVVQEGAPEWDQDGNKMWRPYKIWLADLWHCNGCGAETITGFGANPVAESYQHDRMATWLPRVTHVIDDC